LLAASPGLWSLQALSAKATKFRRNTTRTVEMQMKLLWLMACMLFASSMFAQEDCVKNLRGETVCKNGQTAAAVNPNTGNAAVAHKNPNGVTTTQTSNGGKAKTKNGSGVAQGANGTTAAVNAKTGNAAVAQKNQKGITTTQTTNGGKAKTKNGMGVSQGPGGTDCAKGKNHQGCTTKK
jgi:hypothetical protein